MKQVVQHRTHSNKVNYVHGYSKIKVVTSCRLLVVHQQSRHFVSSHKWKQYYTNILQTYKTNLMLLKVLTSYLTGNRHTRVSMILLHYIYIVQISRAKPAKNPAIACKETKMGFVRKRMLILYTQKVFISNNFAIFASWDS